VAKHAPVEQQQQQNEQLQQVAAQAPTYCTPVSFVLYFSILIFILIFCFFVP
jgi:hypothetical protein